MGYWGYDVMGGDTPCDVRMDFEDEAPKTNKELTTFTQTIAREYTSDTCNAILAVGHCIMDAGLKMPAKVRKAVEAALEEEMSPSCLNGWKSPSLRLEALQLFRDGLNAYGK